MITVQNSRELAAKSAEVRRKQREERLIAEEAARKEAERIAAQRKFPIPSMDYAQMRLVRVRDILDSLDTRIAEIAKAGEGRELRDLSAAYGTLSEQERQLSGRPLPGSYKPTGKPSKRQGPGDISPDLQS